MAGIREPESEGRAGQFATPEAGDPPGDPLGALIDRLIPLSEDQLYAAIGASQVTPDQRLSAAIVAYAPDIAASLAEAGVIEPHVVNLVDLGRRTARRVIEEWGDQLREEVCQLWRKKPRKRDLALAIAAALAGLISVVAGVLAMIATLIARFLMQELCEPERAPAITRVTV
jgi:hypothetical protein